MNPAEATIVERMGISRLWESGYRGEGIIVAVIDGGMTNNAPFHENIVCDIDFTGEDSARDKENWHGAQVAELINFIARDAKIANLRVVPSRSEFTRDTVVSALQHCIDVYPRYRIINISLSFEPSGCPDHCPLCVKVDEAYRMGMLVIVAAGNEGAKADTLTCPARAHWAIANIATITSAEEEYWKKHWLRRLWSTHVTGAFGEQYGTSYSAAYTSGAAALLFSAFPKLDADTLRFAMLEVDAALSTEVGHQTTLKVDRVYDYLLGLRHWASMLGVIFTKNGALRPYLEPF